nr:ribonuclease H-like domain-containing protein [Tanacetum cinerariifolium]
MSLDDLYNHLKVYESEVQKKSEPNSQNMAFISSAKHSSRKEDGNTTCVPTASTNVPTASASIAIISQDTAYHALVADEVAHTEFALMANTSAESKAHSYGNRPFHRTSAVISPYRPQWVRTVNRYFPLVNRKFSTGSRNFPTANRKFPTASRKFPTGSTKSSTVDMGMKGKAGSSQNKIDDKCYWDSGCSRHMTGNISYLSDYEPFDKGYVSFGQGGCKITGKRTIKTGKLEFENVYFMKDLKYNLFSVS